MAPSAVCVLLRQQPESQSFPDASPERGFRRTVEHGSHGPVLGKHARSGARGFLTCSGLHVPQVHQCMILLCRVQSVENAQSASPTRGYHWPIHFLLGRNIGTLLKCLCGVISVHDAWEYARKIQMIANSQSSSTMIYMHDTLY